MEGSSNGDCGWSLQGVSLQLYGYFVLGELPMRTAENGTHQDVTDLVFVAVRSRIRRGRCPGASHDPRLLDTSVDVIVGEARVGRARLNPALHREEPIVLHCVGSAAA
jgi:hypothetical protein